MLEAVKLLGEFLKIPSQNTGHQLLDWQCIWKMDSACISMKKTSCSKLRVLHPLTAFFQLCIEDNFARTKKYVEIPEYYTWSKKTWLRRKRGKVVDDTVWKSETIGRIYTLNPRQSEVYFLRLFLNEVTAQWIHD